LLAGFRLRDDQPWQFEVIVWANAARCLAVATAFAVLPAIAHGQQPSQPIAPGLPGTADDRNGLGGGTAGPIPGAADKSMSMPAEKPMAPPQRPVQPPPTSTR
jgi:hypothetical protein